MVSFVDRGMVRVPRIKRTDVCDLTEASEPEPSITPGETDALIGAHDFVRSPA